MSELRRIIESDYQECVAITPMAADLRSSLKAQERAPALLRNLERELANPKLRRFLTRAKIKQVVYDFTELFIRAVSQKNTERIMSSVAKAAIEAKESERKALEEAVDVAEAKAELFGGPVKLEVPE